MGSRNTSELLVAAAHKADHWRFFAEFAIAEKASGGPDPQLALTDAMTTLDGGDWEERAWRGLCYASGHSVPTASIIWNHFSWERIKKGQLPTTAWLTEHWKGVSLRRERKCVRSPAKLARYSASAANWLQRKSKQQQNREGWLFRPGIEPELRYRQGWHDIQAIYTMGRYISVKFMEYCSRYLAVEPCPAVDIRAEGGWSPRASLVLLWPNWQERLLGDDAPATCDVVERCARQTRERLAEEHGVTLSFFELQVLLCEYREHYIGQRYYPGRSHDEELVIDAAVRSYWQRWDEVLYAGRKKLFPQEHLGEIQGWEGVRKDLGPCLTQHGYIWSDTIFDYHASQQNLANPQKRRAKRGRDSIRSNRTGKAVSTKAV